MLAYDDIDLYLFSFFSLSSIATTARLNKKHYQLTNQPVLWRYKLKQDYHECDNKIIHPKERYKILALESTYLIQYLIILHLVDQDKKTEESVVPKDFITNFHRAIVIDVKKTQEWLMKIFLLKNINEETQHALTKKYHTYLNMLLNNSIDPYVYEINNNHASNIELKELIQVINAVCRIGCELLLETIFKKQRWIVSYNLPGYESEFTFLQNAIRFARVNIVKQLIRYGCHVNKTTWHYPGLTDGTLIASPLLTALRMMRRYWRLDVSYKSNLFGKMKKIIELLLQENADLDLYCYDAASLNYTLTTPKQFCERRRYCSITEIRIFFNKILAWQQENAAKHSLKM